MHVALAVCAEGTAGGAQKRISEQSATQGCYLTHLAALKAGPLSVSRNDKS